MSDTLSLSIIINQKPLPGIYQVLSITINHFANNTSVAEIEFVDGDPATGSFDLSNNGLVVPGNTISVQAGYDGVLADIFANGTITRQQLIIRENNPSVLKITCKSFSKAIARTDAPALALVYGDNIIGFDATLHKGDVSGKVTFVGNAVACRGAVFQLGGVGSHFNGNVIINAVNHVITDGKWISTITYGDDNTMKTSTDEENNIFSIETPGGSKIIINEQERYVKMETLSKNSILIDDDKKIITVKTPANNQIVLSDDSKSIGITDQSNNKISLDPSGITLDSPKDINIKAFGNISLNANGKLDLNATQNTNITGMNITNTANVGFTANGNATAELSASGQTTVKGGIVMIN